MSDICYVDLPEVMAMLTDFRALVEPKLAAREIEKVEKQVFVFFKKISQLSKLGKT